MKTILRTSVMIILLFFLNNAYASVPPHAQTSTTRITGIQTDYGAMFLGIPFAVPPVGDLRWQPPRPTVLPRRFDAVEFGSSCPQRGSPLGIVGIASVDEDCLYLNVYQPKGARPFNKKPVMVWIHGGSNTYSAGHAWDPAKLVEEGVVVATINYRLGALGFMAHPALSAYSAAGVSGNYGIMDQQLALRWVQENIAAFGGNPRNVTIFGQSAGALDVAAHLASPDSRGLFHRAIIQSGTEYLIRNQPSLADYEALGRVMAARMGCPDQSIECLKRLDVEQILQNQGTGSTAGYVPIVDGAIVPRTISAAFLSGKFNRVPVIMGTTHDELSLFAAIYTLSGLEVRPENYLQTMVLLGIPAQAIPAVAAEYPLKNYTSPVEALIAIGTDSLYACNTRMALMLLSLRVKTFGYEFNDPDAPHDWLPPVSFPYGAYHGSELAYLLDSNLAALPSLTKDQEALSEAMLGYWTSFAAYGTPNFSGEPFWFPFDAKTQKMKSLEPPIPQTITDYGQAHHCGFWMSLMF